jgi:hypothetical protein
MKLKEKDFYVVFSDMFIPAFLKFSQLVKIILRVDRSKDRYDETILGAL